MYTNYLIGEGKVLSLFTWDLFYSELFKDNKNRIDHLEGFVTDKKGRHLEDKVKVYLNSVNILCIMGIKYMSIIIIFCFWMN